MLNRIKRAIVFLMYKFNDILRKIKPVFNAKRKILLLTQYEAYDSYVLKYYDSIKDRKNIDFYLAQKKTNIVARDDSVLKVIIGDRNIKIISNYSNLRKLFALKAWDLIVTPCHLVPLTKENAKIPTLFIYHGTSAGFDEDGEIFAYKKCHTLDKNGKCRYTYMLENNKLMAEEMNKLPEYAGKIIYSSNSSVDIVRDACKNKEKYRKELGINDDELAVFVYSTWNVNSLVHRLGEQFFKQLKQIKSINGKKVKFFLSVHPKEYYKYDKNLQPMGQVAESYAGDNIFIRKPSQDWLPYIAASDIVIGDQSSMLEFCIMANKKIVLSVTDTTKLHDTSVVKQAYNCLPLIDDKTNILKILSKIQAEELNEKIVELNSNIMEEKGFYSTTITNITNKILKINTK